MTRFQFRSHNHYVHSLTGHLQSYEQLIVATWRPMPRIEEGPQPHDVHEKTGRYRQKAGISPNRIKNQVAENMDVISNGTRLDRTKKSDTQNEGITRDVVEKKAELA